MKTIITILSILLAATYTLQAQESFMTSYRTPTLGTSLTYNRINSKDDIKYTAPDFSELTIDTVKVGTKDAYFIYLPFKVTATPSKGEIFWLFFQVPPIVEFAGWLVLNDEGKKIAKNVTTFEVGRTSFYLLAHLDLTEPITEGNYKLKLLFNEMPYNFKDNNIRISVGYSSREFYDETFWFPSSTKEEIVKYIEDLHKKSYNNSDEKITVTSVMLEGKTLVRKLSDGRVSKNSLIESGDVYIKKSSHSGNFYISDGNENFLYGISTEKDAKRLRNALHQLKIILLDQ